MVLLYILFAIIIIGIIVISFFLIASNNFNEYIIRINEAEKNIESVLNKRFDYLNKGNDVIKDEINSEEDALNTISNIRSQNLNNFELDKKLYNAIEEFYECSEEYIDLKSNQDYTNIEICIIESESEILALKEYYNDIIKKYNALIEKIPYSLFSKIKKYTEKELFEIKDHTDLINNLKER